MADAPSVCRKCGSSTCYQLSVGKRALPSRSASEVFWKCPPVRRFFESESRCPRCGSAQTAIVQLLESYEAPDLDGRTGAGRGCVQFLGRVLKDVPPMEAHPRRRETPTGGPSNSVAAPMLPSNHGDGHAPVTGGACSSITSEVKLGPYAATSSRWRKGGPTGLKQRTTRGTRHRRDRK